MGHGHAHRKEISCRGLKSPKPKPLSCYVPLALVVCFSSDQAVAVLSGPEHSLFTSDSIPKSSSSVHKVAELFVRVFIFVSLVETVRRFFFWFVFQRARG